MDTQNALQRWLDGQMSLGAAASWDKNEIRIISEIAYSLAQQGRTQESIVLFEGLLAVAPATGYFQSALGALQLREGNYAKAVEHLTAAINIESSDIISLVNRAEAAIHLGNTIEALTDLNTALSIGDRLPQRQTDVNDETVLTLKRARALLQVYGQAV